MQIGKEDVEHIAKLARLNLSEEEKAGYARQLASILEYVEKLKELDTEGVEPTSHARVLNTAFRPDRLQPSLEAEALLKNGPQVKKGFFAVPKVIS